MEELFPELVFTDPQSGMKGVYYDRLSVILLQAVKEQKDLLIQHETSINKIQAEMKLIQILLKQKTNTD